MDNHALHEKQKLKIYRVQIDGKSTVIDENVFHLIQNLQQQNHELQTKPKMLNFWEFFAQAKSLDPSTAEFCQYILKNRGRSKSQLCQDLFVLFQMNDKADGTFLEFGATNGVISSNTFLLEREFGWKGVLAEPSEQWHSDLKKNRPNATIVTECIYSESGLTLDFFVSAAGELSTLEDFRQSDQKSMPGNTQNRNKSGYSTKVQSVALNDVFIKYFDSKPIDYMSVDTEGSELTILENFDFGSFGPKILTVEHNFSEDQVKIDELLQKNNYLRIFRDQSVFDAWYVRQS